jgi:biotin transport system ATP-binding protein
VSAILEENGCIGWADRAVATLSGGQRQLVCVLAVIAPEPPIVLFDEPFASLDLPTRMAFARRLQALPQRIVMASHDFTLLHDFDRLIWLDEGKIRAEGAPDEILPAYMDFARASTGIGVDA